MTEATTVYATIRVKFERSHIEAVYDAWTEVRIVGVESTASDLTHDEAADLPQQIMEASNSHLILNALVDAAAGKDTTL